MDFNFYNFLFFDQITFDFSLNNTNKFGLDIRGFARLPGTRLRLCNTGSPWLPLNPTPRNPPVMEIRL